MNQFEEISEKLRECAAKAVMEKVGELLVKMNTNESGRMAEAVIQLLPDEVFKTMAILVIGQETSDDVSRGMIYEFVFRIATKLGKQFDNPEPITDAAANIALLVNYENMRRQGAMDYLCSNDIFTSEPAQPGYSKLTDIGKQMYYQSVLEFDKGTRKYVM